MASSWDGSMKPPGDMSGKVPPHLKHSISLWQRVHRRSAARRYTVGQNAFLHVSTCGQSQRRCTLHLVTTLPETEDTQ